VKIKTYFMIWLKLSSLKEDHKTVLSKFSQKLKEAKVKEKSDVSSIEGLNADVEQSRREVENVNKKLEELTAQLNEKEELLSKLREDHQSRWELTFYWDLNQVFYVYQI